MSFRLVIVLAALLGAAVVSAQTPAANPQAAPAAAPASKPGAPAPSAAPANKPAATTAPPSTPAATAPANTPSNTPATTASGTAPAAAPPTEAAAAETTAASPAKPGDPTAGQAKAATCAACHGMDGNPNSSQYPKLAGQHEDYVSRQIVLFKTQKRASPIMMGFAMPLSDQDMHDIGAFFASKASLPGVADTKLVARGEALYRGGDKKGVPACMACHGPDGRGNPGASYPQLTGQYADYVSAKLKEFRDGKTWGDDERAKIMPAIAKALSDEDIAAVASYIEGLHNAESGAATAAK